MSSTSVSTIKGFPAVPEFLFNEREHRRQIARRLNEVNQGHFNCTKDVTLNANTGSTVIYDNRIGYNSAVAPMMPLTQSGALALVAATGVWFDPPTIQVASTAASIVVHHAVSSATDQKIRFGIFG